MDNLTVFVGKQPIFDRKGNIYGNELLHRGSNANKFPRDIKPEEATIQLLVNTFLTIGIDKIAGETKSFINFSQKSLEDGLADELNPRFVVIEVLEDVSLTESMIKKLVKLRKKGFTIALDDFLIEPGEILGPNVFKAVDIVKVDFLNTTLEERRKIESVVKKYSHIALLAEKIETIHAYEEAIDYGYSLFQGYYFAKPEVISGKEIPPNYILHLQLIKEFNEMEPDVRKISETLMRDVSLSYKMLRYINSITFGVPNKISSLSQAIMLMGLTEAKRWLRILLLREMGTGIGKGREKALINQSLTRAKFCELLAKHKGKRNADEFFLVGLFSLIHLIMKNDLVNLIPQLSLSNNITQTLLGEETSITPYLELAIAMETIDLDLIKDKADVIGVDEVVLSEFGRKAHHWATTLD